MNERTRAFGGGDHGRQLVPGSLRGYRSWRRIGRRTQVPSGMLPLAAVTRRSVLWAPTLHAECTEADIANRSPARDGLTDAHRSPEPSCECGIYAWYPPDDTMAVEAGLFGAFGVIQASGLVLMGDHGFRAEHAEVVAVVTWNKRVAAACEAAYGADTQLRPGRRRYSARQVGSEGEGSGGGAVKWADSEDIGIALAEKFPGVDPLTIRFTDLREKVVALPGFDDDPKMSNEPKLEAIQMAWYDEWKDAQ